MQHTIRQLLSISLLLLSISMLHAQEASLKYKEVRGEVKQADSVKPADYFLYFDDFKDDHNYWATSGDSSKTVTIADGKLRMEGLNANGHSDSKSMDIDVSKPWTLSCTMRWLEGDTSHGFGLNYCCDFTSRSYYTIMLAANGYYCIQYFENNGDYEVVVPWTRSAVVHKFKEENTIRIRYAHGVIHFAINDVEVENRPFHGGFGKVFGMRANHKQTVEFDDFRLEGTTRMPSGPDRQEDTIHVRQPADPHFAFTDHFDNNDHDWGLRNDTGCLIAIDSGRLIISGHNKKSYHTSYNFGMRADQPYTCSVKVKWIGGLSSYGFGLNYGSDFSAKSFYTFEINAEGEYVLDFIENDGSWFHLKKWTKHPAIHTMDTANILSMRRMKDSTHFFINGVEVAALRNTAPYGRAFGCRCNNLCTAEFDDFTLEGSSAPIRIPDAPPAPHRSKGRLQPFTFADAFHDNRNEWPTGDYSTDAVFIEEGKMNIQVKNENSYHSTRTFPIRTDQPMSCEVTVKMTDGSIFDGYGLNFLCDRKVFSYYYFEINGNGKFSVQFLEKGGKWMPLVPWTQSAAIRTGHQPNTLRVNETADSLYFFINDQPVATTPYYGAYGSDFGMRSGRKMMVEFDDFRLIGSSLPTLSDSCVIELMDSVFSPSDAGIIRIFNHSHQTFFANISIEAYEDNAKGIDRTGTKVGDWNELVHDISWLVKGNDKNYTPDITIPAGKSTELKGKFFGKDGAGNPDFSEYEKFRITATYYNEDGSKGEIHSAGFRMKSKKK